MAANTIPLQTANQRGWRMGLANMFGKECGIWWRTNCWIVQVIIWAAIVNGMLAVPLFMAPSNSPTGSGTPEQVLETALTLFFTFAGLAPAIGAAIIVQEAVVGEKRSGTAAWVLTKPVSRVAFILSKLMANSIGFLATAVVAQGIIAYVQIHYLAGLPLRLDLFGLGLAVVMLHLLFYLALTLMLGTLFDSGGPVIGIPICLLFGQQFIYGLLPWTTDILPGPLVMAAGGGPDGGQMAVAALLAQGQPLPTLIPLVASVVWIVAFVAIALWRFQREEF